MRFSPTNSRAGGRSSRQCRSGESSTTGQPQTVCFMIAIQLVSAHIGRVIDDLRRRIESRVPAAYLTREAWLQNVPFYIDERSIVPRSLIAEIDTIFWETKKAA